MLSILRSLCSELEFCFPWYSDWWQRSLPVITVTLLDSGRRSCSQYTQWTDWLTITTTMASGLQLRTTIGWRGSRVMLEVIFTLLDLLARHSEGWRGGQGQAASPAQAGCGKDTTGWYQGETELGNYVQLLFSLHNLQLENIIVQW